MQLSLLDWDGVEIARGYAALARLDFAEAGNRFDRLLEVVREHPLALRGLEDLRYWRETFERLEKMEDNSAVIFLWGRIREFFSDRSGSGTYAELYAAMIRQLLDRIPDPHAWYEPPDLCAGYLCLLLGEPERAGHYLRQHLRVYPANGRLRAFLGDTLYMQGRSDSAARYYAEALLLSPQHIAVDRLRNRRLAVLIEEHGPELAPVYGYLAGILPLVSPDPEPDSGPARVYRSLRRAEEARCKGGHAGKIAARRDFKKTNQDVFATYMTWLRNGPEQI